MVVSRFSVSIRPNGMLVSGDEPTTTSAVPYTPEKLKPFGNPTSISVKVLAGS